MSDRIAVMNDGGVEQCGTPEDVYERPTTRFVAGFIGISNLMSGSWSERRRGRSPDVRIPARGAPGLGRTATPSALGAAGEDLAHRPHARRCIGCPAPSWQPSTTAPPPSMSSRSPPT